MPGTVPSEICAEPPLVALLSVAKDRFAAEFDRRLAESEFCALSLAHSRNVLRQLGAGPLRACDLTADAGVSKQALSQQIAHLQKNGYLMVEAHPSDRRSRVLRLTERGERAQCHVMRTFAEIEQAWAERLGDADAQALRRALTTLVLDC